MLYSFLNQKILLRNIKESKWIYLIFSEKLVALGLFLWLKACAKTSSLKRIGQNDLLFPGAANQKFETYDQKWIVPCYQFTLEEVLKTQVMLDKPEKLAIIIILLSKRGHATALLRALGTRISKS